MVASEQHLWPPHQVPAAPPRCDNHNAATRCQMPPAGGGERNREPGERVPRADVDLSALRGCFQLAGSRETPQVPSLWSERRRQVGPLCQAVHDPITVAAARGDRQAEHCRLALARSVRSPRGTELFSTPLTEGWRDRDHSPRPQARVTSTSGNGWRRQSSPGLCTPRPSRASTAEESKRGGQSSCSRTGAHFTVANQANEK